MAQTYFLYVTKVYLKETVSCKKCVTHMMGRRDNAIFT